jgi:hypothetical protein
MPEHRYLSMYSGIIFCAVCPHTKIGLRPPIVLCLLGGLEDPYPHLENHDAPLEWIAEGRCEAHRDVPIPREEGE